MRALLRAKTVVLSLSAVAMILACTAETTKQDSTNTFVTVVSMQGLAGGVGGAADDELNSDVCGGTAFITGCSVAEDQCTVTMAAQPKNGIPTLGPSYLNNIVFNRYRVTYIRADGRNVAGLDVPYPFDGGMQLLVTADATTSSASFVIVRVQAKLEPPLRNLAGDGGANVISAVAEVDFYGTDNAGRNITARGYLNVHFADWADVSSN